MLAMKCMVRVRIANLINTTRMSDTMAINILRMDSACCWCSSGVLIFSMLANLVSFWTWSMPSTMRVMLALHFSVVSACQSLQ